MIRNVKLFLIIALSFFTVTTAQAAVETFTLDPSHSYVQFHINHFGFSNPSGKWFANGTLELDQAKLQASKVNITIRTADIVTGIPELDKHLKGKLFFDVDQFPTATFVSNKVVMLNKKSAKVQGMLTVHGVTKPITLNVKLNKIDMNPINNKMTAGFSATTQLKRSDYGMTAFMPGLSDDVKIEIEVEAYK